MSVVKSKWRMGFRDLYGFNLALLGKHCRNLLHNPDSLVVRIFQAGYFSNCTLFNVTRGEGASFIWMGFGRSFIWMGFGRQKRYLRRGIGGF